MKTYFTKNYLFFILAAFLLIGGFLSGIILGFSNPVTSVDPNVLSSYSSTYSTTPNEALVQTFNLSLMIETWISSLISAAFFYAIHLHLNNQRKILLVLQGSSVNEPQKLIRSVASTVVSAPNTVTNTNGAQCSLCKRSGLQLKPARYITNAETHYVNVCESCFKNSNCEELM